MSNNAKGPKGYNNKSVQELQQESQQLLFRLGQAIYNRDFSEREIDNVSEQLEEMESKLEYAKRAEDSKAVAKKNKEEQEDAKGNTNDESGTSESSEVQANGASGDEAVPSTGA